MSTPSSEARNALMASNLHRVELGFPALIPNRPTAPSLPPGHGGHQQHHRHQEALKKTRMEERLKVDENKVVYSLHLLSDASVQPFEIGTSCLFYYNCSSTHNTHTFYSEEILLAPKFSKKKIMFIHGII